MIPVFLPDALSLKMSVSCNIMGLISTKKLLELYNKGKI